ncbi:unnamed protein product [Microthlaspi erraticum]|uniref:Uncharacterized protein n=1 Tax=Microthlaspi erraticum TaxID=1685480 RepID=A0A6D2I9I6_9BRAS|nr:unnamed protein product [Microthlaspi erraticum]
MKEKKPWKFQVDTYALCGIIHQMMHNTDMEVIKRPSRDGGQINLPNGLLSRELDLMPDLWTELFTKLLNRDACEDDTETLRNIRRSLEFYLYSDCRIMEHLNGLLAKQRVQVNEFLAKQRV